MDNIREKLYSLIDESGACFNCFPCEDYEKEEKYKIADYLITNGVTVQEWIPVTERLPDLYVPVLVYLPSNKPLSTVTEGYLTRNDTWRVWGFDRGKDKVTHWMPLPQPPKGEIK